MKPFNFSFPKMMFLMIMGTLSFGALASLWAKTSQVELIRNSEGWVLQVDGEPTLVKGLSYTPDKVGWDPNTATREDWMLADENGNARNDFGYDSFVDSNENNRQDTDEPTVGDFKLMKAMGVNTIRVYHHASNAPEVQEGYGTSAQQHLQHNHAPNKKLMRDLYDTYGIRVAMGDLLGAYTIGSGAPWEEGTDYLDPIQKDRMRASVRQMVLDFKDESFLLLYVIGNENNYEWTNTNAFLYPVKYAQFVEEITQMIHSMDPNHPVALSMGDTGMIDVLAQYAPSVDIFGSNAYRGYGFGTLWQEVADTYDKPVLFTEYGNLHAQFIGSELDEDHQKSIHEASWLDIEANRAGGSGQNNAIGGFALAWLDSWWQNELPLEQNLGSFNVHNEWHGIASQGDGTMSPYLRQLRQVYSTYKDLWMNKTNRPPELHSIPNRKVQVGKTLSFVVRATDPDGDPLTYSVYQAGDLNHDGHVGWWRDYPMFRKAEGSSPEESNYNPEADLNNSEKIDGGDYFLFASLMGKKIPSKIRLGKGTGKFIWKPRWKEAGKYQLMFVGEDPKEGKDAQSMIITVTKPYPARPSPRRGLSSRVFLEQSLVSGSVVSPFSSQQPEFKNIFYPDKGEVVTIGFGLREAASVSVEIIQGDRLVSTILESTLPAGNHTATWDGRNNQGTLVSSGIYRYAIKNGPHTQTGKVLLLK